MCTMSFSLGFHHQAKPILMVEGCAMLPRVIVCCFKKFTLLFHSLRSSSCPIFSILVQLLVIFPSVICFMSMSSQYWARYVTCHSTGQNLPPPTNFVSNHKLSENARNTSHVLCLLNMPVTFSTVSEYSTTKNLLRSNPPPTFRIITATQRKELLTKFTRPDVQKTHRSITQNACIEVHRDFFHLRTTCH